MAEEQTPAPATGDEGTEETKPTDEQQQTTEPTGESGDGDGGSGGDGGEGTSAEESVEKLEGALAKERTAARDARKQVKTLEGELEAVRSELAEVKTKRDEAEAKIADAEGRAEKAEATALRFTVAAEAGLDLELADRLKGDTEDELREDAEAFAKRVAGGADFDGGARTTPPKKGTPEQEHGRFIGRILTGADPEDD